MIFHHMRVWGLCLISAPLLAMEGPSTSLEEILASLNDRLCCLSLNNEQSGIRNELEKKAREVRHYFESHEIVPAEHIQQLLMAATIGDHAIFSCFAEYGFDMNAADERGRTALMMAAREGNVEVVHWLLQNGANPSVYDHTGSSAAVYAATVPERFMCPADPWIKMSTMPTVIMAMVRYPVAPEYRRSDIDLRSMGPFAQCRALLDRALGISRMTDFEYAQALSEDDTTEDSEDSTHSDESLSSSSPDDYDLV